MRIVVGWMDPIGVGTYHGTALLNPNPSLGVMGYQILAGKPMRANRKSPSLRDRPGMGGFESQSPEIVALVVGPE